MLNILELVEIEILKFISDNFHWKDIYKIELSNSAGWVYLYGGSDPVYVVYCNGNIVCPALEAEEREEKNNHA